MKRERIDKILVDRGLADSRTKAQALVMAGLVLVNEQRVDKPSAVVSPVDIIRIKGTGDPAFRYVGRGGLKLEAALNNFNLNTENLRCIDVGASTGGFTDCLFQHGARRVAGTGGGGHFRGAAAGQRRGGGAAGGAALGTRLHGG